MNFAEELDALPEQLHRISQHTLWNVAGDRTPPEGVEDLELKSPTCILNCIQRALDGAEVVIGWACLLADEVRNATADRDRMIANPEAQRDRPILGLREVRQPPRMI